jgi:hypothetical protein
VTLAVRPTDAIATGEKWRRILWRIEMDPHACYIRLIEALAAGDVDESRGAAEDLATWISKGGDVPLWLLAELHGAREWQKREDEYSRIYGR